MVTTHYIAHTAHVRQPSEKQQKNEQKTSSLKKERPKMCKCKKSSFQCCFHRKCVCKRNEEAKSSDQHKKTRQEFTRRKYTHHIANAATKVYCDYCVICVRAVCAVIRTGTYIYSAFLHITFLPLVAHIENGKSSFFFWLI